MADLVFEDCVTFWNVHTVNNSKLTLDVTIPFSEFKYTSATPVPILEFTEDKFIDAGCFRDVIASPLPLITTFESYIASKPRWIQELVTFWELSS